MLPDFDPKKIEPRRAFAIHSGYEGGWDRSPSLICFTPNNKSILAIAEEYGYSRLFMLKSNMTDAAEPRRLTLSGYVSDCKPLRDGRIFISGTNLVDNSFYAIANPLLPPDYDLEAMAPRATYFACLETYFNSNSHNGNKFGLSPEQVCRSGPQQVIGRLARRYILLLLGINESRKECLGIFPRLY